MSDRWGWFACAALSLGILLLTYRSICWEYAWDNDYGYVYTYPAGVGSEVAGLERYQTSEGRPLQAQILRLCFGGARRLSDLAPLRVSTLLGVWLFTCLLLATLRRAAWSVLSAGCLALSICACPGMGVIVAWATAIPFPVALAVGYLAGECALAAAAGTPARRVGVPALSIALQIMALMIHQACAMAFWLPVAIAADRRRQGDLPLTGLASSLGLFALGTLAYLAWFKSGLWPFNSLPNERVQVAPFATVSRYPLYWRDVAALSLLVPPAGRWLVAAVVTVVVLVGFALPIRRTAGQPRSLAVAATIVCLGLLPLALLPCLMVREGCLSARTQVCASATLLLYLYSTLRLCPARVATLLMLALTGWGLALASTNITDGFVRPKRAHLEAFRQAVGREANPDQGRWLFVGTSAAINPAYPYEYSANQSGHPAWGGSWNKELIPLLLEELDGRRHSAAAVDFCREGDENWRRRARYDHVLEEDEIVGAARQRLAAEAREGDP